MNRLIAEAGTPTDELFPPVRGVYAGDAPPAASGILGRAALQFRG